MEFNRNTIIAFVLIGLILILVNTDFYQRLIMGDAPRLKLTDSTSVAMPDTARSKLGEPRSEWVKAETDSFATARETVDERSQEKEIHIAAPLYSGTFSTLGASLKNWRLNQFADPEGAPVYLFKNGEDNLVVQLPTGNDTLNTGKLNFTAENFISQLGDTVRLAAGQTQDFVFARVIAPGKMIRKTYSLSGDNYLIHLKVEFINLQDVVQNYAYLLSWRTGLLSTEKSLIEDMGYAKAYALTNKDLDEFDVNSKSYAVGGNLDWPASWTAVRTKYFTVAIIPQGQTAKGYRFHGESSKQNDQVIHKAYQVDLVMPMERQAQSTHEFSVYVGPLDYKTVKSLGVGLENIMNLGWKIIHPFSIVILWTFTFLHKLIPNYGVVIVVFSILVKIILHPLTKKSYQSMKEMQEIQPLMTAIREKYANDPQRMNQEIMKLYREHGVNPLGGCLPTLLQMPLLYALFIVFRSTIELRQAPFFGWIKDLSAPDTIFKLPFSIPLYGDSVNVLPVIMGATMLVQQAMTMKDPKQKFMVYMMPIIFTLAFNTFPSGLNLYYTLFNIFSIVQQKYMTTVPEKKKKEKKKSYKQFVSDWRKHGVNSLLSRRRLK